ncbi:MAG: hypothetical protein IT269_12195 [Saprospiraceae bacterium]|nr:hypothetical protein [Saprospiraceae bacterium]
MKNIFYLLLPFVSLMLLNSCKQVDKELLGKMNAAAETPAPSVTETINGISAMLEKIKESPAEVQAHPAYAQFSAVLNSLTPKTLGTRSEYEENMIKLRNLKAEYEDGKIKTAEAFAQFEAITLALKGNTEVLNSMATYVQGLPAEYDKMLEVIGARVARAQKN